VLLRIDEPLKQAAGQMIWVWYRQSIADSNQLLRAFRLKYINLDFVVAAAVRA